MALPVVTLVFQGEGPNLSLLCLGFLNWEVGGQEAGRLSGLSGKQMEPYRCSWDPCSSCLRNVWVGTLQRGRLGRRGAGWREAWAPAFPWWVWAGALGGLTVTYQACIRSQGLVSWALSHFSGRETEAQ